MKTMKKVQIIILLIAILCMVAVYPIAFFRQPVECASGGTVAYEVTAPVLEGQIVTQSFKAQYQYLRAISIALYLNDEMEKAGTGTLKLYDEHQNCIKTEEFSLQDIEDCVYYDILVKQSLKLGQTYYYTLEFSGCGENTPAVYVTSDAEEHTQGNLQLLLSGNVESGQSVVRYCYETRLNYGNIACFWVFIWFMAALIMNWTDKITINKKWMEFKRILYEKRNRNSRT